MDDPEINNADKGVERTQSISEVIEILGLSENTIRRYISQGMPVTKQPSPKPSLFDVGEIVAWMKQQGLNGKAGRPSAASSTNDAMSQARLRKELALAELHELKLAQQKGLLIDAAEERKRDVQKIVAIRSKLSGLADKAFQLEGMNGRDIKKKLEEWIESVLMELSQT